MNTTAATPPAPRTFRVTRVELVNERTEETVAIPGMVVTLAELRAMVACAPYTVQVWCEVCGESVADCPDTRNVVSCPDSWSFHHDAPDQGFEQSGWTRHADGLVVFRGA
jgi:hypothetical protein